MMQFLIFIFLFNFCFFGRAAYVDYGYLQRHANAEMLAQSKSAFGKSSLWVYGKNTTVFVVESQGESVAHQPSENKIVILKERHSTYVGDCWDFIGYSKTFSNREEKLFFLERSCNVDKKNIWIGFYNSSSQATVQKHAHELFKNIVVAKRGVASQSAGSTDETVSFEAVSARNELLEKKSQTILNPTEFDQTLRVQVLVAKITGTTGANRGVCGKNKSGMASYQLIQSRYLGTTNGLALYPDERRWKIDEILRDLYRANTPADKIGLGAECLTKILELATQDTIFKIAHHPKRTECIRPNQGLLDVKNIPETCPSDLAQEISRLSPVLQEHRENTSLIKEEMDDEVKKALSAASEVTSGVANPLAGDLLNSAPMGSASQFSICCALVKKRYSGTTDETCKSMINIGTSTEGSSLLKLDCANKLIKGFLKSYTDLASGVRESFGLLKDGRLFSEIGEFVTNFSNHKDKMLPLLLSAALEFTTGYNGNLYSCLNSQYQKSYVCDMIGNTIGTLSMPIVALKILKLVGTIFKMGLSEIEAIKKITSAARALKSTTVMTVASKVPKSVQNLAQVYWPVAKSAAGEMVSSVMVPVQPIVDLWKPRFVVYANAIKNLKRAEEALRLTPESTEVAEALRVAQEAVKVQEASLSKFSRLFVEENAIQRLMLLSQDALGSGSSATLMQTPKIENENNQGIKSGVQGK